jgi:hypothetical protein
MGSSAPTGPETFFEAEAAVCTTVSATGGFASISLDGSGPDPFLGLFI